MSESYDKAKKLLEQLVYTPQSSRNGGSIHTDVIPLEQRSLFERLQSFNPLTWFGKPVGLSSVACATRGWRNTGPDLLTCDSCGAKVWCKLPTHLVSDTAAGIIRGFEQQLTDAHDAACMLRNNTGNNSGQGLQQLHTAPQVRFPVLPSSKLSSSYDSRLQGLRLLQFTPPLVQTTVPRLVAAGEQLHPALPSALAALLQLPADFPKHQAPAAAAIAGSTAPAEALSQQQVTAILALCGWQVQPLLPPHLAKMVVSRPSSAFGVSHLVPRSGGASSSRSAAAAAGSIQHSSSIPAEDAALCCELCGCKVGLWKFSKSGPYYMAQLASKVMSILTAADAAFSQQQEAAAAIAVPDIPAVLQHQLANSSADAGDQVQSTIAGGPLQVTVQDQQPHQPEQQQQDHQDTVASPDVVVSSLYHTIAGGSLFRSGAVTAGLRTSPGLHSSSPPAAAAGFCRASLAGLTAGGATPGFLASPRATRAGPFGAPTAPAFGSSAAATAGDSSTGLFGLPSPAVATASLFGETAGPAVSGSSGPFGAAPSASPSAAPVFGLGALREEEQRTKRRRSSSDAAAGVAAAAAAARMPSFGRSLSASPGLKLPLHPPAGPSPEPQQPPAKQQKTEAAVGAAIGGGSSSGRLRSFMKQQTMPAAAAAAEQGLTGSAETFDPISQHRTWCPWVNTINPGNDSSNATARAIRTAALGTSTDASGIAAALAVGWCSTLLALQEQLEEQHLLAGGEPQQQGDDVMQGLLGEVPKPGQFGSTAAVLAKARQMFDALEG